MEKTKTVAIICIVGFVLVGGLLIGLNRDRLFGTKAELANNGGENGGNQPV